MLVSHFTMHNLGVSLEKGFYVKSLNVCMFLSVFDVECWLVTPSEVSLWLVVLRITWVCIEWIVWVVPS